jgi:hypothetical protein
MPNLTTLNIGGMNSWSGYACDFDDEDDDPTSCTAATEGWFLQVFHASHRKICRAIC